MSLTAAYSPGSKPKQLVCVEVNEAYSLSGAYLPSGPNVQGTFTNPLTQPIVATISVSLGGTVTPAGPSFNLGGAALTYIVTVSFNRKYSGSLTLTATSLDNSLLGGLDKICNASVGNPDILTLDTEVVGNCLQAVFGSNPITPRIIGWSEVNEITTLTFTFTRTNIGSTLNLALNLVEKSLQKWEKSDSPVSFKDPITSTIYTTLPVGVFEVNCEENNEVAFYNKELCYKIYSSISFDISVSPAEPWDAYLGIRPRQDGIPFLTYAPFPFIFAEFSKDAKRLYSVSGGTLFTNNYNGFALSGFTPSGISFIAFPAAAAMTPVGIAVHPSTDIIYIMYMDAGRRLFLTTLVNNILNLVGDCQFTSVLNALLDGHDITFSKSGQLLMVHGDTMYLVDSTTGIINAGAPVLLTGTSVNNFSIGNITKYYNGDLHLSGLDNSLGSIVLIYDGESYTKIKDWASDNSITPPDSPRSIAYPTNPEIKFNRLYVKNIETDLSNVSDTDLVTGLPITLPNNALIADCSTEVSKEVSWTEDICYVIDKLPVNQGFVEIVGGQIVSNGACTPIGGFVPPVAITYSSMTNSITGNAIYALRPATNQLDTYTWNIVTAPVLGPTLLLTGIAGTPKSIRTRWSDGSVWLMTEATGGIFRNYTFYTVNLTTGVCTQMGVANYPTGANSNGYFTFGLDDNIYFSYSLGGTNYRISTLSKTNFYIQEFVADVNYVVDNINTDVTANRLIISKSLVAGLDFMSYSGLIVGSCAGVAYQDAMSAPLTNVALGDTIHKVKKVFIKDLITGDVRFYYHDRETGQDVLLPTLARVVSCDKRIETPDASVPRFRLYTGVVTWNRLVDNNRAKSITLIRVAGNLLITDGFTASNVNAAFTVSWVGYQLAGNLQVSGTAAGSSFIIASI